MIDLGNLDESPVNRDWLHDLYDVARGATWSPGMGKSRLPQAPEGDVTKAKGHGGDAETLRRYWTHGKGGTLKVRWGEPGDFDRCVRHVGKFMEDPKGYCAERHHDALGIWPVTHAKELRGKAAVPGLTKRSGMVSIDLTPGTLQDVDGGVDDHHVTLVYLGKNVTDDLLEEVKQAVQQAARGTVPFTMQVGGLGRFPASASSGGDDVHYAHVTTDELTQGEPLDVLRQKLQRYHASEHQDFTPHVTLKYGGEAPEPQPWVDVPVTHLNIHVGGEVVSTVPLGKPTNTGKMKVPAVQILKVGPEGYIHGFICVRPPCGHGTTKAWRDPKNGKIYHGGHLEGKTYVGGQQIGGIRKNADGTFSGQHNGAVIGSGKMKLMTKHQTHQEAVDSVAEYHNLHLLAQHATKQGDTSAANHLHAAANALASGDAMKAHTELTQARNFATPGQGYDSIHEQLKAHEQLHGMQSPVGGTTHDSSTPVKVPAKKTAPGEMAKPITPAQSATVAAPTPATHPTAPWAKAGGEINTQDLSVKKNGDVVHKPTGTVVGHLAKQADTPKKGTSTFTATHADGTHTHTGVYKGNALASIALHHNSKMKGGEGHVAQPEAPAVSVELPKPKPKLDLPAKVTPAGMTLVPGNEPGSMDFVDDATGKKIGETIPTSGKPSFKQVKHVDGTVLDVKHFTSSGAVLPGGAAQHAKLTLSEYHNSLSGSSSSPTPPSTPEKKDYEKLGAINAKDVFPDGAGDLVHKPTGTVVGHYKPDSGGYTATHADSTAVPVGVGNSPSQAVAAYHNKKYAGITEMTAPAETPVSPVPEWAAAGHISYSDDAHYNTVSDKVTHNNVVIGEINLPVSGGAVPTHASGKTLPAYSDVYHAKKALINYHNDEIDKLPPSTSPAATVPSAPAPEPPPAWLKAGTAVKPTDVSVKQDGTHAAIDKVSKQQIGTVSKNWHNAWVVQHEDGTKLPNSSTKKEAVAKLANYHNQTTAIHQVVKKDPDSALAKLDPGTPGYNYKTMVGPVDSTTGVANVDYHSNPWDTQADQVTHLGTIKTNPDGTATVTHAHSGATWTVSNSWEAKGSLAYAHQQAVKLAKDESAPKPKPSLAQQVNLTPVAPAAVHVPKSVHTTLGNETLSAGELAAVKKYTGSWYGTINKKVALAKLHHDQKTGDTAGNNLTSALDKSELTQDMTLHRGINDGEGMLGPVGSQVGKVGVQHSFMSTSTKEHVGQNFGGWGSKGLLLTIHAPKGAKGMDVKGVSYYSSEAEILLQRGTMYHVNSDVVGSDGRRRADITIVGISKSDGNHTMYNKIGQA
jgi:2'-5' RNA ligase